VFKIAFDHVEKKGNDRNCDRKRKKAASLRKQKMDQCMDPESVDVMAKCVRHIGIDIPPTLPDEEVSPPGTSSKEESKQSDLGHESPSRKLGA
jgi:hypothetical protein